MIFDYYIFSEGSFKNISENGKPNGFQLKSRIPYYRGVPLSMVLDIDIKVDGKQVDRENIEFSPNDGEDWFTLNEMSTVSSYKWEFGKEAMIFVKMDGGLPKGEHEIALSISIAVAYSKMPFMGERTRLVTV